MINLVRWCGGDSCECASVREETLIAQAEKKRAEKLQEALAERTIDAQRTDAPVPRDTVQLYEQMREVSSKGPWNLLF